ncbi:MAG TPA: hypothetical protein VIL65_11160 [Beijerinckiaceae bacterium]|jgi:hypothetical protein
MPDNRDPRSEAEKARADLKANSELGYAPSESPVTFQPSVTPATFGVTNDRAKILSGTDQGLEAGGEADRRSGAGSSIAEAEQVATGRDGTAPDTAASEDVLSRAKE